MARPPLLLPRSSSNCPAGQTNNSKKLRRRETKDLWAQFLERGIPIRMSEVIGVLLLQTAFAPGFHFAQIRLRPGRALSRESTALQRLLPRDRFEPLRPC